MTRLIILGAALLWTLPGHSRQLVLVQGYLGDASSWRSSGVTSQLEQYGWMFGGKYHYASDGVRLVRQQAANPRVPVKQAYYLVSLPTEGSIAKQAYFLLAYLKHLRGLFPTQPITLAGHSAGGVVARYVMVRNPDLGIDQLISIAAPNLGTDSAEFGRMAGDSPLALFAPLFGANTLNRSQGLYRDLLPEMPHRFLFWLNRQPHPEAEYVSIVRDRLSPNGGDFVVPEQSQYLENVFALRYRARSYVVTGDHGLSAADGRLLVDLLREVRVPSLSFGIPTNQVIRLELMNINNRLSG